jgi:hypothetical protein
VQRVLSSKLLAAIESNPIVEMVVNKVQQPGAGTPWTGDDKGTLF